MGEIRVEKRRYILCELSKCSVEKGKTLYEEKKTLERVLQLVINFSRSIKWSFSFVDFHQGFLTKMQVLMSITIFLESAIHSYLQPFCFIWNSRLRVIAEIRHGDIFHSANIVSRWVVLWNCPLNFWYSSISFYLCNHDYVFVPTNTVITLWLAKLIKLCYGSAMLLS